MAHLQYMPGDPRLVDQLVYELKSKGIFDQFRKECIADVDTRPAYQNLRQRVENSVSTFLARQVWQPDLNKNQLREKLRKHILDGNYLEQGVERIVDQVVNPKVASVFIPQVEDLVYNYLGISRKKTTPATETSNGKISTEDLLPTDLEAVSPGSVKSTEDKNEDNMDADAVEEPKMEVEEEKDVKEDSVSLNDKPKVEEDIPMPLANEIADESNLSIDKKDIPLPTEEIKLENIPAPVNSPPKVELEKIELHKIELPKEPNIATEMPTPEEIPLPIERKNSFFKPTNLQSEDDSSSDSSLRRNMSPLTPIRNFNNENSCDAQQAFDNDSDSKSNDKKEPSTFRFAIETKSTENSMDGKSENKDDVNLSYQFNNQVNINAFNTPMSDDSSNSNNLHIDYESDANSKTVEKLLETDPTSEDSKKDKKADDKKSSYKSSHRSRDSHRHSSSKDKRSDSKHSNSRDSSRHDKKSKEEHNSSKSKSSHREREKSKDRSEKKDSRDSSRHKSSHKSSSHRDSKSHRSSSTSTQKSSSKHDDKRSSSSSHRDKGDKSSKDKEKDRSSKSSSHRSEKDRKSSSSTSKSKQDDKDKKKEKKDIDDHYGLSGRGNPNRRSTDRDSNDGSSSSKGFHNQPSSKASDSKKGSKSSSSKSDNTSPSGESTSPSDKDHIVTNASGTKTMNQQKPIRVDNHLEVPIASPPRLPFVPDVTLKKPKFAANFKEAKKMMRMRKFLDEEQKRMNQEAALLLEFQANVRPSLSQVYSSIPGPELEFACGTSEISTHIPTQVYEQNTIIDTTVKTDLNSVQEATTIDVSNEPILSQDEVITQADLDSKTANIESPEPAPESVNVDKNETYNENKPFAQLVDEITEYSKASERNKHSDTMPEPSQGENISETGTVENPSELFEVTVITEELSESEDVEMIHDNPEEKKPDESANNQETTESIPNNEKEISKDIGSVKEVKIDSDVGNKNTTADTKQGMGDIEDTIPSFRLDQTGKKCKIDPEESNPKPDDTSVAIPETVTNNLENAATSSGVNQSVKEVKIDSDDSSVKPDTDTTPIVNAERDASHLEDAAENPAQSSDTKELRYFSQTQKYDAEIQMLRYQNFYKAYLEQNTVTNKIYLFNCDSYEENLVKEVLATRGQYEIVNYVRNGKLKLPNIAKNVVKDVNLGSEVILPVDAKEAVPSKSPPKIFSPVKSECSFELSSDYDAKLEEMVNKTSRQEVMEIILGSVTEESDSPKIDYCMDSSIDSVNNLKRKLEVESTNNNRQVLVPKIRRLSESDQITSTTEETKVVTSTPNYTRSKYMGRAKRVGLPRPKRTNQSNSPSSDKSVENYSLNCGRPPRVPVAPPAAPSPNGKLHNTRQVQRYDKSDLYKPKLHYLCRRNNIS